MKFKLGLCQLKDRKDKAEAMEMAEFYVGEAVRMGADIISLPELWNTPMISKYYREFAEEEGGKTYEFMANLAKKSDRVLIGGSIPEIAIDEDGSKHYYNASFIFNKNGELIGKHRKAHMFDIDVKDGIRFKESDTFEPGEGVCLVDTEFGKIGVAICFDLRFAHMYKEMADRGAKLIVLPAAFNMTTGPAHWELLIRSRALDNQVYFAACSSARTDNMPYIIWGNSTIANPYGAISAKLDEKEGLLLSEIDYDYVDRVRQEIPIGRQVVIGK